MTFVLFRYRRESASAEYIIARLGSINKNRYCKDIVPTGILSTEYKKQYFAKNSSISFPLSIITSFHCFKTDIDSILSVNVVRHQEVDDVIVSRAARSASRFLYSVL